MSLKTLEYLGEPLTFERQLAASDAVASISPGTYKIKNKQIGVTGGGTYEPQVNDIIIDGTNGAQGTITRVGAVTSGTWGAGTAAGTLFLHNVVGTFTATATTLKLIKASDGSAVADAATSVAASFVDATVKVKHERECKGILVEVLTNPINYTTDGSAPTIDGNTTLAGHGINAVANTNFVLEDIQSIKNFKWINGTGSSNAEVRFQGFFD